MLTLFVMRGLPGSGKSTTSSCIAKDYSDVVIHSTDDFFIRDGKYDFKPAQIGFAHLRNQNLAMMSMIEKKPCIIIDNTNCCAWDIHPYVKPAILLGYDVKIIEPSTSWAFDAEECFKRTIHNVPLETIKAMLNRWEPNLTLEQCLKSSQRRM